MSCELSLYSVSTKETLAPPLFEVPRELVGAVAGAFVSARLRNTTPPLTILSD